MADECFNEISSEMKILNYILQGKTKVRGSEHVALSFNSLRTPRLSNFHLINIRCENKINDKFIMYQKCTKILERGKEKGHKM